MTQLKTTAQELFDRLCAGNTLSLTDIRGRPMEVALTHRHGLKGLKIKRNGRITSHLYYSDMEIMEILNQFKTKAI